MDDPTRPKVSLDPNDYDDVEIDDPDNPELTEEDFARARPLREVLPDLYEALKDGVVVVTPTPDRKAS
jgi:hypothetical protein